MRERGDATPEKGRMRERANPAFRACTLTPRPVPAPPLFALGDHAARNHALRHQLPGVPDGELRELREEGGKDGWASEGSKEDRAREARRAQTRHARGGPSRHSPAPLQPLHPLPWWRRHPCPAARPARRS